MPARTTLSIVLDEAERHTPGPPNEVLDWAEVVARSRGLYADTVRSLFLLGPDADVLAYEPLIARIMGHLPAENFVAPVDRYHHASLIATRVLEARR